MYNPLPPPPRSKSFAWMLFILGIIMVIAGFYITSQSPNYAVNSNTDQPFVESYNLTGAAALGLPGVLLIVLGMARALAHE